MFPTTRTSNKLEDNGPKRVDLALYRVRRRSLADSAFPGGAWERGQVGLHQKEKCREEAIDPGNTSTASVYASSLMPPDSPSPYGVWGAMGTRTSESKKRVTD